MRVSTEARIKIAVQKSGRLTDHSLELLVRCGLSYSRGMVHRRVAGLPAAQKALDRRVHDTSSSSARPNRRWPRTAASSRGDRLERAPAEVAGEDDVHHVLRRNAALGRDRVDDRDGALDRQLVVDPDLLRELPVERVDRLSPELTPPPGSSQYSLPGFSCRQSRMRSVPAQDRRDADPRLGASARWRSRSRARRARSPAARRPRPGRPPAPAATTSCAIRMPGSTTNGSRASVLSSTTRSSPR